MEGKNVKRRIGIALMALACLSALDASQLRAQNNGVVFGFQFGYKEMGGDLGKILDGGIVGEYDFSYQAGSFRYGIAFNLVSLDVSGFDESVSQVNAGLYATWLIKREARVLPYLQLRLGGARYRPEGGTFAPPDTADSEVDEEGENAADAVNGFEGSILGGAEFALSKKFAIDLSAGFSYIATEEVDLSAIGLEPVKRGTAWTARLGVRWNP
jgi:opacity protein-like surface antigen